MPLPRTLHVVATDYESIHTTGVTASTIASLGTILGKVVHKQSKDVDLVEHMSSLDIETQKSNTVTLRDFGSKRYAVLPSGYCYTRATDIPELTVAPAVPNIATISGSAAQRIVAYVIEMYIFSELDLPTLPDDNFCRELLRLRLDAIEKLREIRMSYRPCSEDGWVRKYKKDIHDQLLGHLRRNLSPAQNRVFAPKDIERKLAEYDRFYGYARDSQLFEAKIGTSNDSARLSLNAILDLVANVVDTEYPDLMPVLNDEMKESRKHCYAGAIVRIVSVLEGVCPGVSTAYKTNVAIASDLYVSLYKSEYADAFADLDTKTLRIPASTVSSMTDRILLQYPDIQVSESERSAITMSAFGRLGFSRRLGDDGMYKLKRR